MRTIKFAGVSDVRNQTCNSICHKQKNKNKEGCWILQYLVTTSSIPCPVLVRIYYYYYYHLYYYYYYYY